MQGPKLKKCLPYFEGVTAIVFMAAMSEYDQVSREDEATVSNAKMVYQGKSE